MPEHDGVFVAIGAELQRLEIPDARSSAPAHPKAGMITHIHENADAANIRLTGENLAAIDQAHPPPRHKQPLVLPCSALEFLRFEGRFW
jgi:hypothetical protein